jgi:hypothetical protein
MSFTLPCEVQETDNSPLYENWGIGGTFNGAREFRVPYDFRHTVSLMLMGMEGTPPLYPDSWPGYSPAVCVGVDVRHEGKIMSNGIADANVYQWAILTAKYTTDWMFTATGLTYIEESYDTCAEPILRDNDKLYWQDLANPGQYLQLGLQECPTQIIRSQSWNVTLYNMLTVPSPLFDWTNTTNQNIVTSGTTGRTFQPETLLYVGCAPNRQIASAGATRWRIGLKFAFRQQSWNLFPRRDGVPNQFYPIYYQDPQGNYQVWKPYPVQNFSAMGI